MPNLTFYILPKDEEKIVLIFFLDLRKENFSVEQTICTSKQKHWGSTFQPSNNIIYNCDLQGLSVAYQIQVITCRTLRSVKRTRQEICGYRFISGFTLRNVSRYVSRYVSRDNLWGVWTCFDIWERVLPSCNCFGLQNSSLTSLWLWSLLLCDGYYDFPFLYVIL